jgi:hypothetical protein
VGCCEHDKEVTGIVRNLSRTELLCYSQEEICSVRFVSQISTYLFVFCKWVCQLFDTFFAC